ncbi:hypothetical protein [Duganella vulcania]|uniref:Uncharacterized protein n=1 Tax=Duganella vulcania TaxID=2692166 RepID=A0A845GIW2_9BURK|nr:hypothetical protein [Duganella vulcania]MYM92599.1 hypothetical protein [Duganella vulcania]
MHKMTDDEWKAELRRLTAAVTRKRNQVQCERTLAEKVAAKERVKLAESALRKHKLHYYELTGD